MHDYHIQILGPLPEGLLAELRGRWGEVATQRRSPHTDIVCELPDDAALRGLLTALWNAGLTLTAVEITQPRTPDPSRRPCS